MHSIDSLLLDKAEVVLICYDDEKDENAVDQNVTVDVAAAADGSRGGDDDDNDDDDVNEDDDDNDGVENNNDNRDHNQRKI